jgi:GDP-mannose 6-dehydrogenase
MKISIFGLGYVGCVSLGCLAQNGHSMIGVDIDQKKVDFINDGKPTIVEKGIDQIISEQRALGRIVAMTDSERAARETDVSFICVGTPPTSHGHLDLSGVSRAAADIAKGIATKSTFHVIAIRSTVLPGTNRKITEEIEKATGKRGGEDFAVVSNPEFLREGTAVKDYFHPPYTLIGTSDPRAEEIMRGVYEGIDAPVISTDIRTAELIKYVNNAFHALKISFANEIGSICKQIGIDSHRLMEIFCADTKLNIAPNYLKPGFAYGGSCLPKDLKALCTIAHDHYLKSPVLESIDASNEQNKSLVLERILSFGKQRVGFLGLSFKGGTDDLRSSPIVDILEKLLGKGIEVRIYDKNVQFSKLVGANREFILQRIPFISRCIVDDAKDVFAGSDVIVVVNDEPEFKGLLEGLPKDRIILDLVNVRFRGREEFKNYHGVAW